MGFYDRVWAQALIFVKKVGNYDKKMPLKGGNKHEHEFLGSHHENYFYRPPPGKQGRKGTVKKLVRPVKK